MSSNYDYHQLLKYLYFEGYVDSYEEAEYLLEEINDDEFDELCEEVFYENVSSGRGARARSGTGAGRAPIPQRVTASQAAEIRRSARRSPEPEPEPRAPKAPKGPTTVPSRGVSADEPALRRRTPEGHRKRGASPVAVAKRRARLLSTGQDTAQQNVGSAGRYGYARRPTEASKARAKKIRAALKKSENWGTPQANAEEYVLEYLVLGGYTDSYDSAIEIMENMSEDWMYDILEGKIDWQKGKLSTGESPFVRAFRSHFDKYSRAQTTRGTQAVRGKRGRLAGLASKQAEKMQQVTQKYHNNEL